MTNVTMELEDRYVRLKSISTEEVLLEELKERDLKKEQNSQNYGFFIAMRYFTRLVSLSLSTYYFDKVSLKQVFSVFAGVTFLLLIYIVFCFHELKVISC